jgi:hypothetical protein
MLKKLRNEDLYNPNPLPDIIYEIKVDHMREKSLLGKAS